ncbi:MAG: hypothetical protein L0312_19115, partial [Acidobacteria bacterium]|nr:hypothetical protein [Acidobacteriota bacterium]
KGVRITLQGDKERLSLTVQDDEVRFEPGAASGKGGLGLIGIEERVRELGGRVTISSHHQQGTLLKVVIPLLPEVSS